MLVAIEVMDLEGKHGIYLLNCGSESPGEFSALAMVKHLIYPPRNSLHTGGSQGNSGRGIILEISY